LLSLSSSPFAVFNGMTERAARKRIRGFGGRIAASLRSKVVEA
jgi:hypothetical protein